MTTLLALTALVAAPGPTAAAPAAAAPAAAAPAAAAPATAVAAADVVTVTAPGPQTSTAGSTVALQLTGTGPAGLPLTWSATGLPAGLALDPATGLVAGIPTAAGSFAVTVTATAPGGASGDAAFGWTVNPAPPCPGAGQKVGNPGFEGRVTAPWTATAGVVADGETAVPARTGLRRAWLGGYGIRHVDTISQTVTVPAGCTRYALIFWVRITTVETTRTLAYDRLFVQADGSTLVRLSNLDRTAGYVKRTVSLARFAGRTVTLRFTSVEDAAFQTSFLVDDVALSVR